MLTQGSYVEQHTFEERKAISSKYKKLYPDKVPTIIELENVDTFTNRTLDKYRFLFPCYITAGQAIISIRYHMCLTASDSLFLFVEGELVPSSHSMQDVYETYKRYDNLLYMVIAEEKAFGCGQPKAPLSTEAFGGEEEHPLELLKAENALLLKKCEILEESNFKLKQEASFAKDQYTSELKNKVAPPFGTPLGDIPSRPDTLKEAFLAQSKLLGTAKTQIIFLHNQLRRNVLQLDHQCKIINAAQQKEDLFTKHTYEKISTIKKKYCEPHKVRISYGKAIKCVKYDKDMSLSENINYSLKENIYDEEELYTYICGVFYKESKNSDVLQKIKDVYANTNELYVQKYTDSQNELRTSQEQLNKLRIVQENMRLEHASSKVFG